MDSPLKAPCPGLCAHIEPFSRLTRPIGSNRGWGHHACTIGTVARLRSRRGRGLGDRSLHRCIGRIEHLKVSQEARFAGTNLEEKSVPSSFQYPLERHRDLQRKWSRLLQRTVPSEKRMASARVEGELPQQLVPPRTTPQRAAPRTETC
jgi:hypothetical protein